jgi:hypothetical protein
MHFSKLEQELGFKLAIKICLSKGSTDFFPSLKIGKEYRSEPWEALASVIKDSALEDIFLASLKKLSSPLSFEWWRLLCCQDIPKNTESHAVREMKKGAYSFSDWVGIYRSSHDQNIQEQAAQKMRDTAISYRDWDYFRAKIAPRSEEGLLLSKMKEKAVNFHEFEDLLKQVPKKSADYKYALSKMKETADAYSDWSFLQIYAEDAVEFQFILEKKSAAASRLWELHSVWNDAGEYPKIRASAMRKMREGDFPFYDWRQLLDPGCGLDRAPLIKELVFEKLKEKASSLAEWRTLYELAKEYPSIQNHAFEMMEKTAECK